jgi:hypothetical protein
VQGESPHLEPPVVGGACTKGLYRGILAGPGCSLADAFAHLDRSPWIEQTVRHSQRDLRSVRVTLMPEEGRGYWDLTRIRNHLFFIIGNFAYKDARFDVKRQTPHPIGGGVLLAHSLAKGKPHPLARKFGLDRFRSNRLVDEGAGATLITSVRRADVAT